MADGPAQPKHPPDEIERDVTKPDAGGLTSRAAECEEAEASSTGGVEHADGQESKAGSTSGTEPIRPATRPPRN